MEIDEDALASGRVKLTRLKLRFPDGTPIDTTVAHALPPARDLTQGIPVDVQSVTVLAALALPDANGNNCRMGENASTRPRRSYREFVKVVDMNGSDEVEIAAERHALRLLFDFEPHADDTVCAIARLTRSTSGHFALDSRYVPPCLSLSGHALHVERINRLCDILLAKVSRWARAAASASSRSPNTASRTSSSSGCCIAFMRRGPSCGFWRRMQTSRPSASTTSSRNSSVRS